MAALAGGDFPAGAIRVLDEGRLGGVAFPSMVSVTSTNASLGTPSRYVLGLVEVSLGVFKIAGAKEKPGTLKQAWRGFTKSRLRRSPK